MPRWQQTSSSCPQGAACWGCSISRGNDSLLGDKACEEVICLDFIPWQHRTYHLSDATARCCQRLAHPFALASLSPSPILQPILSISRKLQSFAAFLEWWLHRDCYLYFKTQYSRSKWKLLDQQSQEIRSTRSHYQMTETMNGNEMPRWSKSPISNFHVLA